MKVGLLLFFSLSSVVSALSQTLKQSPVDSVVAEPADTILISSYTKRFNPRKALFYSAIVPGAGQVYNKKYWKVPIVYGGFYLGYYLINAYQSSFIKYKGELFGLLNDQTTVTTSGKPPTSASGLTQDQLRTVLNRRKRDRDFWCIITGVWYMLQMVDAHVDSHLKEFDVNPQLKVTLEPMMESDQMIGRSTGFAIKFKF